ncbi:MAG: hypothetical protein LBF82_00720 [Lactobacillales bacterium]|jgi:hypothetical protein|nr:hypothetical protein [Lactobacillales bacterium]
MKKKRMIALVGPAFEDLSLKEMLEDQGEKNARGEMISNVTFIASDICAKVMNNLVNVTMFKS